MKYIIILLAILLFLPLVNADSTFYDNPDDAFVSPNPSVTSSVISQQESSGGTGGGCLTNWACSSWSGCINDIQTRNCTKIKNYCYAGTKPNETQSCTILPEEKPKEKPAEKSVCGNGICEKDKNKTSESCQQDCLEAGAGNEKPKELGRENNLFVILIVGIIMVGIIVLLLKRKKR